jgi:molecular chaperone HtpG
VDYPFNLTGILYFPKVKNDFELHKNKIQLYSRQVFITDEVKDIVPEFLMLLHGVIDSPDIPLNVSRSYLQADSNVKKINSHITKKVADKLSDLFKNDQSAFESKWESLGLFVKYGMISDEKFYEKAVDFCLFKNVDAVITPLNQYKEKVAPAQTDKDGNVVWLYSNEPAKQDMFIQSAKKRGYDVLVFDSPIDPHFIQNIEHKLEKVNLKRVDSETLDKLIQQDTKKESVLTEKEKKKVQELFEKAINNTQYKVSIEAMAEDELPVSVSMPEFMRRMKETGGMGGMSFMGNFPDTYNVAVNGNHPLIQKIVKETEEEKKAELAKYAYQLGMLSQNLLSGNELTTFIGKSVEMLANK